MNEALVYNVKHLRVLREVHLRGTLAAAADALGFNPSTVSHQLATLEREVGTRLLEPTGRQVRLTDSALILVEHAGEVLRHLEEAEAAIASAAGEVRGLVRVAIFQTAAHAVLAEVTRTLASRFPKLDLRVAHVPAQEALPRLVARDFDVVLHEEFPGHPERRFPGLDTTPAAQDPLWLVSSAGDPVGSPADAAHRGWAMEPPGTLARRWSVAICRHSGFEPRVTCESSDVLLHLQLAREGAAVAFVPGLALGLVPGVLNDLSAVRPPGRPDRLIFLSVRRGARRSPATSVVRDSLAAVLERRVHPGSKPSWGVQRAGRASPGPGFRR